MLAGYTGEISRSQATGLTFWGMAIKFVGCTGFAVA